MSDTPETDKQWAEFLNKLEKPIDVFVDFARKLERERDEARDTISDVLRALGAMEHEGSRLAALRVKEERDQARRELDIQLESIKFHMERVPVREHPLRADDAPLSGAEHEMSDTPETQEAVERWRQGKINIFDEMARLERERDKLKAWIDGLEVAYTMPEGRLWKEAFIMEAAR